MTVDLDEAKKAEDRLRHSEACLAEAQRLTHTGAYGLVAVHADEDSHGNKTFPRRIVYGPTKITESGGSIQRRDFRTTSMRCAKKLLKALHEKRDYAIQTRIVLPDGTIIMSSPRAATLSRLSVHMSM